MFTQQANNSNMERLRADLKNEVTSTVKTPQDRVVYQVLIRMLTKSYY